MTTFVLMTRLAPSSAHDAAGRRAMGKEWLKKVKAVCPQVKFLAHYAILGPYDFMDVYEAPDVETAHRVSLISRAEGALSAESWQALSYERFLTLLEEVQPGH
ncbi:MAG: GYD domain-containing protein [Acidobacteriota bacterium]